MQLLEQKGQVLPQVLLVLDAPTVWLLGRDDAVSQGMRKLLPSLL